MVVPHLISVAVASVISEAGVTFHCVGACQTPVYVTGLGGNAMMGGHMYPGVDIPSDLVAYRWFLDRANGGDVLVLTADEPPCDIYNPFLYNMSGTTRPNSVTTACFTSRDGAASTTLHALLARASGLFMTGGDQQKYESFWKGTPVAAALSSQSSGAVVGGSSAGLAVQGQFLFDAAHGGVSSEDALKYPTDSEVSLARAFLHVDDPWMRGVLTDTHFKQRDRMGRLVTFVARIAQAKWAHGDHQPGGQAGVLGVGISEHTALLVDPSTGTAAFAGVGPVHFVASTNRTPSVLKPGQPLSWDAPGVDVWRWDPPPSSWPALEGPTEGSLSRRGMNGLADSAAVWMFQEWTMRPKASGTRYQLRVKSGVLSSTQPGGGIY